MWRKIHLFYQHILFAFPKKCLLVVKVKNLGGGGRGYPGPEWQTSVQVEGEMGGVNSLDFSSISHPTHPTKALSISL